MKLAISLACVAVLLGGCAGSGRPSTGPGSGYGSTYVPDVKPTPTAAPDYDATVAKCQKRAGDLPYIRYGEHDEATFLVSAGTGYAFGVAAPFTGIWTFWAAVPVAVGVGAFAYWVDAPERQRWYKRQESMMADCMAQAGYENQDPSVKVTWVKFNPTVHTRRSTGVDTYNAERLAKTRSCQVAPMADLVSKGPGFEIYRIPCADLGKTMVVRCEFGNCRDTGPVLGATADKIQVGQK
ncbi:hypothetical protein [Variovorax saccharolyticus]|uniref:hypothetical protein n=1 Tax=Variovorax saccharolyticus TaxID=3053516 RepID=UPI0025777CEB|nr:hypothetical protein [Variovorax sp. J22R187]MDM0020658.1 hypothetical protein [Variovorax sp. J22R187]